ncbi:hypothetical protein [Candidatus Amarobacter glycogenicus]|uniref:hypothetical protein n=1 Tax=Candidatus Amarobacter glycogenicus TaxID=3140699 RepID=UPI002A162F45|nr:hypothetical protein [Dehalococcoidia bacterium]
MEVASPGKYKKGLRTGEVEFTLLPVEKNTPVNLKMTITKEREHSFMQDGASYVGEFSAGKLEGKGVYKDANGDSYTGAFVNNNKEGKGVYTFANGSKYTKRI